MKRAVLFILFVSYFLHTNAQAPSITKYKSMFTLNFIRYVGWSEEYKRGDFIVGVLKNSEIAKMLKTQSAGKKFGYQNIVVEEFKSVDAITPCHVLYVGSLINYGKHSADIISKSGKQTLIITENSIGINKGSVINFIIKDSMLKFEVSPANARKQGIRLNSALLNMKNAIVI